MVRSMYAVFDSKSAFFGVPFSDLSDASAIRNFTDAVRDGSNPQNMWHNHPEDFSLFCIGSYDDQDGRLTPSIPPTSLITASAIQSISYVPKLNGKSTEEILQ